MEIALEDTRHMLSKVKKINEEVVPLPPHIRLATMDMVATYSTSESY